MGREGEGEGKGRERGPASTLSRGLVVSLPRRLRCPGKELDLDRQTEHLLFLQPRPGTERDAVNQSSPSEKAPSRCQSGSTEKSRRAHSLIRCTCMYMLYMRAHSHMCTCYTCMHIHVHTHTCPLTRVHTHTLHPIQRELRSAPHPSLEYLSPAPLLPQ